MRLLHPSLQAGQGDARQRGSGCVSPEGDEHISEEEEGGQCPAQREGGISGPIHPCPNLSLKPRGKVCWCSKVSGGERTQVMRMVNEHPAEKVFWRLLVRLKIGTFKTSGDAVPWSERSGVGSDGGVEQNSLLFHLKGALTLGVG